MTVKKYLIDQSDLVLAAEQVGCTKGQAEEIWKILNNSALSRRGFDIVHTIYYFGGMIVFCALVWFLGKGYELYGKTALFFISFAYALSFYAAGMYLWKVKQKRVLGGIGLFLSLSLIPLVTYAFQLMVGWWPTNEPIGYTSFYSIIHGGWFFMDITTLAFTAITLRFAQFPLLSAILYTVLLYMSEDILPFFFGVRGPSLETDYIHSLIRIGLGVSLIFTAFLLERKGKGDFAFWGYLFGVNSFWIGMTLAIYKTEWGYFSYCVSNVLLLMLWPILNRRVFAIFGFIGVINYLGQLAWRHFSESNAFPIILSFVGLFVIGLGVLFQRYIRIGQLKTD